MTQKQKLQRTINVTGTIMILAVLVCAAIAGSIQFGSFGLVTGLLVALPVCIIGTAATVIHVAADTKLNKVSA